MSSERPVWVDGETYDTGYLFDVASGSVVRRVKLGRALGMTAGLGRRCGRSFLAVYVSETPPKLFVQVDHRRFVIDEDTRAAHTSSWLGSRSSLRVSRPGEAPLQVSCFLSAGALLQGFVDPGYDELQRSMDDFPAHVADIIGNPEMQDVLLEVKSPEAGPW